MDSEKSDGRIIVVATEVSGNLGVVSSGENGILIPPKSPEKMANAVSMLLDEEKQRKELGKNARKKSAKKISGLWSSISESF